MDYTEIQARKERRSRERRSRYALCRRMGFTSAEATMLQFCSEQTIERIAQEKKGTQQ